MTLPSAPQALRKRRHFSPALKAEIVAQCLQADVSVSRIELDNCLDANMLRCWMRVAKRANTLAPVPAYAPVQLYKSLQQTITFVHHIQKMVSVNCAFSSNQ